MVMAPVVRGRKGEYGKMLAEMRAQGYARAMIDGELRRLDEEIDLDKKFKHDISIVVDRLVMKEGIRKRLSESIEAAAQLADGLIEITDPDTGESQVYSERFACLNCGASMPEIEPRIFSFNSPHGACERCHGLGFQRVIDPELIVPDPTLSIVGGRPGPVDQGRLDVPPAPARGGRRVVGHRHEGALARARSERARPACSTAPAPRSTRSPTRTASGDAAPTTCASRACSTRSRSATRTPTPSNTRDRVEELMAMQPCPACKGARLRPESLAVTVGGLNVSEFTAKSAKSALEWVAGLELNETERAIAHLVLREVEERLRFLDSVGIGYLSLERAASTLSGGEAQRIRLATQIGSSLVGVMYILDEPSIGLHQRDNEKLIGTLERLRDIGNTVMVVEHDEGTMNAADHLVDLGPGAGEHGGEIVAEGTPAQVKKVARVAHGPVPVGQALDSTPGEASQADGRAPGQERARAQPEGRRCDIPARHAHLRHRGFGLGQVDPRQRDPLPLGCQPPAPRPPAPGCSRRRRRHRADRQDHQHRPVADRSHAALQPGDLHGSLRRHP